MTPWEFKGRELVNCNCAYGCPCQFNALPTQGHCEAVAMIMIDEGHYGDVRLDGLAFGLAARWPGPIHEGGGQCQPIVDAKADERQREALLKIMSGEDTDPGATIFQVFAATFAQVHDPVFAPVAFEVDVDARHGRIEVGDVMRITGDPIRNPVTGEEHRARIDLPQGFEYAIAEIGSASASAAGKVAMKLENSHAQFARLHMNNHGVVRPRKAA